MTLTHMDYVNVLDAMGVTLPLDTKLSTSVLDKRLSRALESTQSLANTLLGIPLDPSTCPPWYSVSGLWPLPEALERANAAEMTATSPSVKDSKFAALRRVLLKLAEGWSDGDRLWLLRDRMKGLLVAIHIAEVHAIKEDIPLMVVLFTQFSPEADDAIVPQLREFMGGGILMNWIDVTPLERSMMLKLLDVNSKRLSPRYKPRGCPMPSSFVLSFLLPLTSLGPRDVVKLIKKSGCEVCGETETSRCAPCKSVSYCSPACQKKDWQSHREQCQALKAGTWRTLTFATTISGTPAAAISPLDIYGGKTFVVKIEAKRKAPSAAEGPESGRMFVCDQQNSFKGFLHRQTDPEVWTAVQDAVKTTGFKDGSVYKIYRWVRRVGGFQLEICLDNTAVLAQSRSW